MALNFAGGQTNISTRAGGASGSIDDLIDVVITNASTGQILTYNGTVWVNNNNITAGNGLISSNIGLDTSFAVQPTPSGGIIVNINGVSVDNTVIRTNVPSQTINGNLTITGVLTSNNPSNLIDANTLDGNDSAFYRNASNINAGTLNATYLANSGVTAGVYGSASTIPALTVDAKGRITLASSSAIIASTEAVAGIVRLATAAETNSGTSSTLAVNPINLATYYAKKASPAFTGAPTAPTAAAGTNSTQIATTAFVAMGIPINNADNTYGSSVQYLQGAGGGSLYPTATWASGIRMLHSNASGYYTQISCDFHGDNVYLRRLVSGSPSPYRRFTMDGEALPLTGGTMSGSIINTSSVLVQGYNGGTTRGYLYNDGGGIGLLSSVGNWALRVEQGTSNVSAFGTFVASGNVGAFSDIRLKTNIEVIPDALNKVCSLRGVTYDRTDIKERQAGLIAQEVQKILPEVVTEGIDENKTLSIAYGNLSGLLVEAIKELTAESKRQADIIEKQSKIIDELTKRIK